MSGAGQVIIMAEEVIDTPSLIDYVLYELDKMREAGLPIKPVERPRDDELTDIWKDTVKVRVYSAVKAVGCDKLIVKLDEITGMKIIAWV